MEEAKSNNNMSTKAFGFLALCFMINRFHKMIGDDYGPEIEKGINQDYVKFEQFIDIHEIYAVQPRYCM